MAGQIKENYREVGACLKYTRSSMGDRGYPRFGIGGVTFHAHQLMARLLFGVTALRPTLVKHRYTANGEYKKTRECSQTCSCWNEISF